MQVRDTKIAGLKLIEPQVHGDARGFFVETYQAQRYAAAGIAAQFVQDNLSRSGRGVLRGMHFQHRHPQGKLVSVLRGEVFDVAVDIRRDSPTYGHWEGAILSAQNKHQMWIPPGLAHGFLVLSEFADFAYKCTDSYHPDDEYCLAWDDPTVGIDWPLAAGQIPQLSAKDQRGLALAELPQKTK
ncbi:MAG: dTDP-4-dehydrorhamnose 3,5-epimerase [Cellvibrionales bacterium]|nr:dTDP-4-dehydrorhamnose 3,5-epimerase [Cellvibrionales bacterium]